MFEIMHLLMWVHSLLLRELSPMFLFNLCFLFFLASPKPVVFQVAAFRAALILVITVPVPTEPSPFFNWVQLLFPAWLDPDCCCIIRVGGFPSSLSLRWRWHQNSTCLQNKVFPLLDSLALLWFPLVKPSTGSTVHWNSVFVHTERLSQPQTHRTGFYTGHYT